MPMQPGDKRGLMKSCRKSQCETNFRVVKEKTNTLRFKRMILMSQKIKQKCFVMFIFNLKMFFLWGRETLRLIGHHTQVSVWVLGI